MAFEAFALILGGEIIIKVFDGDIKITLAGQDIDRSIIADVLVRGGARLLELREDEIGLEEVFMRVTRGETQ